MKMDYLKYLTATDVLPTPESPSKTNLYVSSFFDKGLLSFFGVLLIIKFLKLTSNI